MKRSLLAAALVLAACHDATTPSVRSVLLRFESDSVFYGEKANAMAVATGDSARVRWPAFAWSSSDTTIAVVDSNGVVLGLNPGEVTIAAEFDGKRDDFAVRVVMRRAISESVKFLEGSTGYGLACAIATGGVPYCKSSATAAPAIGFAKLPGSAGVPLTSFSIGDDPRCGFGNEALYCWLYSDTYLIGGGSIAGLPMPAKLPAAGIRFSQAAVGGHTTACGIGAADSIVYCWGHYHASLLGRDAITDGQSPQAVTGNIRATYVAVSDAFGCAIDLARHLQCWGTGTAQLGFALSTEPRWTPQPLLGNHEFVAVGLGGNNGCGVTVDGSVYCWGQSIGITPPGTRDPVRVSGEQRFASVWGGYAGFCGITVESDLYCWGAFRPYSVSSRAGDQVLTARQVARGVKFRGFTSDFTTSCGIAVFGDLFCW